MKLSTRMCFGWAALIMISVCQPVAVAQTIWVEGERPARSSMNRHPWWYDQVKKDQLSGGDWISNFSEEKEGEAEYAFDVPRAARYAFWIRANPIQAALDYAIDKAPAKPIDMGTDVLDTVNLAADDKPDLRFLGWKKVGEFPLARGRHTGAIPVLQQASTSRSARRVCVHNGAVSTQRDTEAGPGREALDRTQGPGPSCRSVMRFARMPCLIFAGSMRRSPARVGLCGWPATARASCWATARRHGSGG